MRNPRQLSAAAGPLKGQRAEGVVKGRERERESTFGILAVEQVLPQAVGHHTLPQLHHTTNKQHIKTTTT